MQILILGADGQVGWELRRSLSPLGRVTALGREAADLERPLRALAERHRPGLIVNAAAYNAVDRAEAEPERALRVNGTAVGELAQAAAACGALLVHYSTDYVFDGAGGAPYREDDAPAPLGSYARSKLAGEHAIAAVPGCRHLIFRTSWVYAARGRNFARVVLDRALERERLPVVAEAWSIPTPAELIADVTALAARALLREPGRKSGLYHLAASGGTSRLDYARHLVERARARGLPLRLTAEGVEAASAQAMGDVARRPRDSRLDNRRLAEDFDVVLPDWREPLERFVDAYARERAAVRPAAG